MVVVDEFSQGLQPSIATSALQTLRAVAAAGVSVLVVEQGPALSRSAGRRTLGVPPVEGDEWRFQFARYERLREFDLNVGWGTA